MLMATLMTGKQVCVKRTHVASGDGVGEGNSIVSFISLFRWHFQETGVEPPTTTFNQCCSIRFGSFAQLQCIIS